MSLGGQEQHDIKARDTERLSAYLPEPDTLQLAQEAVKAGLIREYVLDHLTSLHSQVPNSMKQKYLLMHLYNTVNNERKLFIRMVQVFVKFRSYPLTTTESPDGVESVLGTEHTSDLIEFLVPYASHWRSIGTALRFPPHHLNNISASPPLFADAPRSYLVKLLEDWILGHAVAPTVSALEDALKSRTVGLGMLAGQVRKHVVSSRSCNVDSAEETQALPYYIASVSVVTGPGDLHITAIAGRTVYIDKVGVKENRSVLLETEVVTKETLVVNYQWLENEIPLSESEVYRGTTKPILCISNADIDMDGFVYSCKLTVNGTHTFETRKVSLKVSCPLDQHATSLAAMYSAKPEVPVDTWPRVSSKKHINLALVKQEKLNLGEEYGRLTVRRNIDDILQNKTRLGYGDILKGLNSRQVLFVEGRPGCGKTTFVHKITCDWAASLHPRIRLVFLVSLRALNSMNKPCLDLSDILSLFQDLKIGKKLLEDRCGKGVCFIFDGLDEFSPCEGKKSIVHKIINKDYLVQSTVIVASRPAALAEFRDRADRIVEVLGLPNEQIFEYFDHYPFSVSTKSESLKAYLPSHPNILHMCYLPIHAAMVGYIFEVTGQVPKTETEIYRHFTQFTLLRNLSRKKAIEDIDIHNLNESENRLFYKICKLALEKMKLNKQILQRDVLRLQDEDCSLGLITVDRTADLYGYKNTYTFLHLTFQEYLAAHYISKLSDDEQVRLLEKYGSKSHMLVVWKFYCGLVEFSIANSKFKLILGKTPGGILYHIQCAYESQQSLPCNQLPRCFVLSNKYLTTPDCTALGYVLNKYQSAPELSLIKCDFSLEAVYALLLQIENQKRYLETLHFHFSKIGTTEIECFSYLLKCLCFKRLAIRTRPIKVTTLAYQALASCLKYCTDVEELDLSDNQLNVSGVKIIASELASCHNLGRISLKSNDFSESTDGVLSILQTTGTNLKYLDISSSRLGDSGAKNLSSGLKSCRKLERIIISNNSISAEGALAIFESISQCNLQIDYKDVTPGNEIRCGDFESILQHCDNLQSLDIAFDATERPSLPEKWKTLKEIRMRLLVRHSKRRGVTTAIACSLRDHFGELHTMSLNNFSMVDEEVVFLADSFSHFPNLKVLDLSSSRHLHITSIKVISMGLINCSNLTELHLDDCEIDCEGATALSLCLKNPCLLILSLCVNSIDFQGFEALINGLNYWTQLEKLNLRRNRIERKEAETITSHLKYKGKIIF